ncbi:MAG: hypothetical protein KU29_02080 [Sulfurovum sp. FS06-10]|nr:MAG: hypothetical protein KU29_02080 [Sulfurovum sp. FS06-10]
MKFTKLSLIAALAVTATFATESTIGGDAKLYYGTTDANNADLFNKGANTMGNAAVSLDYSRGIADGVTLNAGLTGVSTLGLEGSLVGDTWVNHGANLNDRVWIDVANITATVGQTTAVIGRQALDTPLAFTEKWSIANNTFDAAVLVNNDIQDTTLIGAWVGRGNGDTTGKVVAASENIGGGMVKYGALSADNSRDLRVANNGVYAVAAVTKLIPNTVAQVWYYNVQNQVDAVWAQADVDATSGVTLGLQYANIALKDAVKSGYTRFTAGGIAKDSSAFAGKLGYAQDALNVYAAYSKVDKDGLVYIGNTATGGVHGGQSKLYTEAWWNYNFVGQADAQTIALGAGYDLGAAKLGLQYTRVTNDSNTVNEMDEVTLTASTKVGPVDATLALINTTADNNPEVDGNTVQAYLTVPFSL